MIQSITKARYGALAILAALVCALPAPAQRVVDEIAVVVNDDIILRSDIDNRRMLSVFAMQQELQGADLQAAIDDMEQHLVRDLIDETLLLQKAEEFELDATVFVLQQMDAIRQQNGFDTLDQLHAAIEAQGDSVAEFERAIETRYLTQQVLYQEVDYRIQVTTEELRARYDADPQRYDQPEGVLIQEIVFGTEGRDVDGVRQHAEEVLARARDGEDFARLAAEESDAPTARNGGELPFTPRGDLLEEYEEVAYQLERSQISDIIELPDRFAIIRLVSRHRGGLLPFELARNNIALEIQDERAPAARRAYLDQLRRDSFISIHEGYVDTGAPEDVVESAP